MRFLLSKHAILFLAFLTNATLAMTPTVNAGLVFQYTGTVFYVDDPYDVFANGTIPEGTVVSGDISYGTPTSADNIGFVASYVFNVSPSGESFMTTRVAGLSFAARSNLTVQAYNPVDYGESGVDFQFNDGDKALLTTASLPAGYQLGAFGAVVSLWSSANSLTSFPNLPASLIDLSAYDRNDANTIGYFYVNIFDSKGAYVTSSSIAFDIASIQSVPEPSSVCTCLLGIGLILTGRFRKSRQVDTSSPIIPEI